VFAIAVTVRALWRPGGVRTSDAAWLALFGFLQGWLSFDFAFVVTFLPLPFWMFRRREEPGLTIRSLGLLVVASGASFTLAHVMHFAEVAAFYGGAQGAIADFTSRARFRVAGEDGVPLPFLIVQAIGFVLRAAFGFASPQFGPAMIAITIPAILAGAGRRIEVELSKAGGWRVQIGPAPGRDMGVVVALVISLAWAIVMPAMAIEHALLVSRLFLLYYLCCAFLLARHLRVTTVTRDDSVEDGAVGLAAAAAPARRAPLKALG